jgi:hypothetical protein
MKPIFEDAWPFVVVAGGVTAFLASTSLYFNGAPFGIIYWVTVLLSTVMALFGFVVGCVESNHSTLCCEGCNKTEAWH